MAALLRDLVIFAGILAAVATISGCTTMKIGDAGYNGENITFTLDNSGTPSEAFVQVTAYNVSAFTQQEYLYVTKPVSLGAGTNRIAVPAKLPAGSYKLYIYVIQDGERKAAVIRDIGA